MLFFEKDKVSTDDTSTKGVGFISQLEAMNTAINDTFLNFKSGTENVFEKLTEKVTQMENQTLGVMRSMGGVFAILERTGTSLDKANDTVGQFQNNFMKASKNVLEFGGSSKDVLESIEGIADAMGRAVFPSQAVMENIVALSKTTGLTVKEVSSMVEKLSSFGGTQEESTKKISEMAKQARMVGLDATKFVKSMAENVDKVGGFGFKDGVKSLQNMTKQAQMLKTTFSSIVGNLQDTVLDPEGAIETAAKFQMLGGEVGKLADPFQLMYMAQTDMEGFQKELVKSSQAAFKFNKETGNFDASTQDLYRLREQAQITGTKLEDLVKTGREAAKLDYIKDKFNFDGLKQEEKELLAGLAQIDTDGNVTVDIPGFGKIEEGQALSADATKALEEYQKVAAMDEKDIAVRQLTTTERNARDVEIIKNAILYKLVDGGAEQREKLLQSMKDNQESYNEATKDMANEVGQKIADNSGDIVNGISSNARDKFREVTGYGTPEDTDKQNVILQEVEDIVENLKNKVTPETDANDLFVPSSGQAPKVMAEGKIFKGIVGDEVAMGTNLTEAFSRVSTLKDLISNQTKNTSEKQNLDGNLKIDINVGGKVDGDKNNDMSKLFSNPIFQKQVMDMVLYKMKDYQKQQGVL
jgi:hypothetical protein